MFDFLKILSQSLMDGIFPILSVFVQQCIIICLEYYLHDANQACTRVPFDGIL
jgi:hypothetical protein